MPIQSFKDASTRQLFAGQRVKRFEAFEKIAMRKLAMLHGASLLSDLNRPPGNRLEVLASDRAGQHSIRINRQFRLCFIWTQAGPACVEICDYH